jgi:uncharacterized membrane protein YkvI
LCFAIVDHSPVDDKGTTVLVSVPVVVTVLPDNNRFTTIAAVPIPIVVTVTIAITVAFTYGHAMGAYTDSDVFRCSRNCAAKTHYGGYYYCVLDH